MDNTETNIKMCEKAEEIQKAWVPSVGDYVWRKYTIFGEEVDSQIWDSDKMAEIIILTYASSVDGVFHATKDGEERIFNSHNEVHKATCIWLPRQDQLQEMVYPLYEVWGYCIDAFENWRQVPYEGVGVPAYSMEQLWLAFAQKENHNKVWDGETWIKEEK